MEAVAPAAAAVTTTETMTTTPTPPAGAKTTTNRENTLNERSLLYWITKFQNEWM